MLTYGIVCLDFWKGLNYRNLVVKNFNLTQKRNKVLS